MRISPVLFGSLVLVIFLGTIFGFQSAGVWSISGKVDSSGQSIQPSENDVESIKGWMTFEQITNTYDVPLADILAHFNLPADTQASTAIKDLESDEFSVDNLRTWLQSRVAPMPLGATTPEPSSFPQATPTTDASPVFTQAAPLSANPLSTDHVAPEKTVTAKTTFQDLLDWGVTTEIIQEIIGSELPPAGTVVKTFITGKGMEFSPIKAALQAEVDKTR